MFTRLPRTLFFLVMLALIVLEPNQRRETLSRWGATAFRAVANFTTAIADRVEPGTSIVMPAAEQTVAIDPDAVPLVDLEDYFHSLTP